MSAPACKTAGPRMLRDSFIKKPSHKPRMNVVPRKTSKYGVYCTCRWNDVKMVAWSRFDGAGPRNLPYFSRKSPLNHNSALKPLETTRINIAGVSARKRNGEIPLLGNNAWKSPRKVRR